MRISVESVRERLHPAFTHYANISSLTQAQIAQVIFARLLKAHKLAFPRPDRLVGQPSPWINVEQRYPINSHHRGEVVNVVTYGAFVKLEPGVEGLVDISEMHWTKRIKHANEVVALGDMIEVQVMKINTEKQEISLGMVRATGLGVDREVAHCRAFRSPVLGVSPEWVLLLGRRASDADVEAFPVYQYRVGSLEQPSLVKDLTATDRLTLGDRSPGRANLRELRRVGGETWVRTLRLAVDPAFGITFGSEGPCCFNLGRGVVDAVDIGDLFLAVAYESIPYRVEVRRLPTTTGEVPHLIGVGYLPEPPAQVMVARGPDRVCLVVRTDSGVTWFDLTGVPGIRHGQ